MHCTGVLTSNRFAGKSYDVDAIHQYTWRGIRTRVLKIRALKDISPKNTIPNGHES